MKPQWRIKKIVYVAVITALVTLSLYGGYCLADQYFMFGVRVGMTRDEVVRILGRPTHSWSGGSEMHAQDLGFVCAVWVKDIIPNNIGSAVQIEIDDDKVRAIYVKINLLGKVIEKDYE